MKTTYSTYKVGTSPLKETTWSIGRNAAKSKEKRGKKAIAHFITLLTNRLRLHFLAHKKILTKRLNDYSNTSKHDNKSSFYRYHR